MKQATVHVHSLVKFCFRICSQLNLTDATGALTSRVATLQAMGMILQLGRAIGGDVFKHVRTTIIQVSMDICTSAQTDENIRFTCSYT